MSFVFVLANSDFRDSKIYDVTVFLSFFSPRDENLILSDAFSNENSTHITG